jgi:hypothetical protein
MRAFIEEISRGRSNGFRLRQAYAQYLGFLFGQTWSTFSDRKMTPKTWISRDQRRVNVRQPQVRYRWIFKKGYRVEVSARTRRFIDWWRCDRHASRSGRQGQPGNFLGTGRIQLAAIYRDIRGTSNVAPEDLERTHGYGGSEAASSRSHALPMDDRFVFQINIGTGIAHYINDLNTLGAGRCLRSHHNRLEALPVNAWYVDYEHIGSGLASAKP